MPLRGVGNVKFRNMSSFNNLK